MALNSTRAPRIVRKARRGPPGRRHGGLWKLAYADFATAMMAFFLLMWLLGATTEAQKQGLADYFAPAAGRAGAAAVLPPAADQADAAAAGSARPAAQAALVTVPAAEERRRFEAAAATIRRAIEADPGLKRLAGQLLVDHTDEGLRIQLVDRARSSMFPSGSAEMPGRTRELMGLVAKVIARLDNKIAIKGHTDATPFHSGAGYSNWELSSDRANASRRALIAAGLPPSRIAAVVGRADQDPLLESDPAAPQNRRISIVLLRNDSRPEAPRFQSAP